MARATTLFGAVAAAVALACGAGDDDGGRRMMQPGGPAAGSDPNNPFVSAGGSQGSLSIDPTEVPPQPAGLVNADSSPFVVDDTAIAGLPQDVIDALKRGGSGCNFNLLYPYDGTVFPVGLMVPTIMWDAPSDATLVRMTYDGTDAVQYEFANGITNPGEITIPQAAWNEITSRSTAGGLLRTSVSTMVSGNVSTCERTIEIAPGVMSGAVYYNTYNAPAALNPGNGAVMRLQLGQPTSDVFIQWAGPVSFTPGTGPCTSCHSVSADGSTMLASNHSYDFAGKFFDVFAYDVAQSSQPPVGARQDNAVFGGLTPDGTRVLTMGNPDCTLNSETFPRSTNNIPLVEGPDYAKVLDVETGREIPATGLDPNHYMWWPQFSPTGDRVVFNHAKADGAGGTDRRELAVMDYDYASNAFSNLRVIVSRIGPDPTMPYAPMPAGAGPVPFGRNGCSTPALGNGVGAIVPGTCSGPCYPASPFFTPDGKGVIFALVSEPDFTSAFPGRAIPAQSELWYVDVESAQAVRLDNLNRGLAPEDPLANYYPTVMPVAAGGKFWVFWTAKRLVGHRAFIAPPSFMLNNVDPNDVHRKRLWLSAIDIEPAPGVDPSYPGSYIAGQSDSGNVRAFTALNPCKPSDMTCASGLDCCTGFCNKEPGAAEGLCSELIDPPRCSMENERCEADADCCPPGDGSPTLRCFGGFCGRVVVR